MLDKLREKLSIDLVQMSGGLPSERSCYNQVQPRNIEQEEEEKKQPLLLSASNNNSAVPAQQQLNEESNYHRIGFEMKNINFDMLRKKRAFLNGADASIMPVPTQRFTKKNKPIYSSFVPIGDVLPIEARESLGSVQDYAKLFTRRQQNGETQQPSDENIQHSAAQLLIEDEESK